MAIIDFRNKSGLYWGGLGILAISFMVLFSTVWYAVYPIYTYYGDNNGIVKNLMNSTPIIVGSMIFLALGLHMTLSGRNHNA